MQAALSAAVKDSRARCAPALIGTQAAPYRPQPEERPQPEAAHARARWPWKLQTLSGGWTDAEACLIDVLLYLGGDSGCFDAYRLELGNRAGISPTAQRMAEARLRDLGLLEVTENRLGYARNQANSYRLTGLLRHVSRMLWSQRGVGTKSSTPSGGVENLQPHTSPTSAQVKRSLGQRPPVAQGAPTSPQSGEVCMPLGRNEVAKPPEGDADAVPVDEGLALDLVRTFLPGLDPREPLPETADDLMDLADRLQRTYAPTLWPQVWQGWRRRFGLTAALAVLETGIMRRSGKIRASGAQYLSGILGRNRRQVPAPEATLQAIRASRRAPGLARTTRWPSAEGGRP
jgi:hypothetical protein